MNTAGKTCFVRLKQGVVMFLNLLFRGKSYSHFPGPEENQERRSVGGPAYNRSAKCNLKHLKLF